METALFPAALTTLSLVRGSDNRAADLRVELKYPRCDVVEDCQQLSCIEICSIPLETPDS